MHFQQQNQNQMNYLKVLQQGVRNLNLIRNIFTHVVVNLLAEQLINKIERIDVALFFLIGKKFQS